MTQIRHSRPAPVTSVTATAYDVHSPAGQAYRLLRTVFTIAPIAFGLDKFAGLLTDWDQYLAP